MDVKKAVIPAAGLGTRFLPATKSQPKEMLPIIDTPTIHYVVEEVVASGISDIIMVTGRGKRALEDYFDKNIELEAYLKGAGKTDALREIREITDLVDIHYVRQKEQLGLGHAILCAEKHIGGEPFAVLLGDDIVEGDEPCTKQLINISKRYGGNSIAVEKTPLDKISRYGVIDGRKMVDRVFEITGMVEKPKRENAPSEMTMVGRYVLMPEVFDCIEDTTPGANGEIQLTDALKRLLKMQKIYGYEFRGMRYDIGDKMDYLRATVEYALKRGDTGPEFKEYLKGICHKLG